MITADKLSRLRPLLFKAYWAANTPNEFNAVRCLFLICGLGDPLHNHSEA